VSAPLASWLLVAFAAARPPVPDGLRPVVADVGAPGRFAAWRKESGLPPVDLACEPALPGAVLLCFRIWEGGARRWVTVDDLRRWGLATGDLRTTLIPEALRRIETAERIAIEGTSASYLRLVDGDGWAAAAVLAPGAIAARLGAESGSVRVAFPAETVFVAWRSGDADLDRIMAVGVRELYDAQPASVSPGVFTWDGRVFTSFGEAVPSATAP
jgi:hypothetical protein